MAATPPTFNPAPAKSGNKIWLWLILALVAFCVLVCAGGAFFFKNIMGSVGDIASCVMSGDIATKAILAYSLDHDGELPPAANWQDDVRPYYDRLYEKTMNQFGTEEVPEWLMEFDIKKSSEILECDWGTDSKTGFAYNSKMAGTNTDDYERISQVVLLYETLTPGYNAYGNPDDRPETPPDHGKFAENEGWIDFMLNGKMGGDKNPFESSNMDMNVQLDPEDGLEEVPDSSDSEGEGLPDSN